MKNNLSCRDFLKLTGLSAAGLALTACGATPTSAPTATSIPPTEIPPPAITPTASQTSTSEPQAKEEIDIHQIYTETAVGLSSGVPVITNVITDKTLGRVISRIERDDSWRNYDNAMTAFTVDTFYNIACKAGGLDGKGVKKDNGQVPTLEEYMTMVAEARAGSRPFTDVQFVIKKLNDTTTPGYDPKPTTIWPWYDRNIGGVDPLPEGVRSVKEFSIAFYRFDDPAIINHDPDKKGFGSNIEGETLYYYRGLNTSNFDQLMPMNIVGELECASLWLSQNRVSQAIDHSKFRILSNDANSNLNFRSVFKVIPA